MTDISVVEVIDDSGITVVEVTIPGPQGVPGIGVSLGGTLADGDYGDIAVSGGGSIMTYDGTVPVNKGGTGQTTEAEALGEMTQALTEDTTPDRANDFVMTYDASADTGKKAKIETVADVVKDLSPQLGASLDANSFNIGFDDNTGIDDDSGNEIIRFQKVSSAINYLDIYNAATGNESIGGPIIEAKGDDLRIPINITPKANEGYLNMYTENIVFSTKRGPLTAPTQNGNGVLTVNFIDTRQGTGPQVMTYLVPGLYDDANAFRYGTYLSFNVSDRSAGNIRTRIVWNAGDDSFSGGGGYGAFGSGLGVGVNSVAQSALPGDGYIRLDHSLRMADGEGIQSSETGSAELLKITSAASAVNELTLANAATGGNPSLLPTGDDTDISFVVGGKGAGVFKGHNESIIIACSDETTALSAGTSKVEFRMPYAFTVKAVRASLSTAQSSGSIFTVDINESGTTIISTKLTIDNSEKTSTTAATPAVISDTALADDAIITVDIDQVGDGTAKGLKVYLIGKQA